MNDLQRVYVGQRLSGIVQKFLASVRVDASITGCVRLAPIDAWCVLHLVFRGDRSALRCQAPWRACNEQGP